MQTQLSQYPERQAMVRDMGISSQSTPNAGSSDFVNVHENKLVAVGDEHGNSKDLAGGALTRIEKNKILQPFRRSVLGKVRKIYAIACALSTDNAWCLWFARQINHKTKYQAASKSRRVKMICVISLPLPE
ncbi:MAG: hypothetical protein ACMG6H_12315 [Acidobacteriota bacterium]